MDQTRTLVETAGMGKDNKIIKLRLLVMQQERKRKRVKKRIFAIGNLIGKLYQ